MDDPVILEAVWTFGGHVGVVAQLANDLAGIASGTSARGSDLRRGKKTLPIVYALSCAREEGLTGLLDAYEQVVTGEAEPDEEEHLARMMRDLGAAHYTGIVAEAHRGEALAALRRLARMTGRREVYALRSLLPPVRWRYER